LSAGNRPSARRKEPLIAITDPGSKMQKVAESDGFRHVFFGMPSIGGRYSVLSDFGLAPAAIMGDRRPGRDRIERSDAGLILGVAHNQVATS
jgi:glucose-6-phosphate isomerase